jgi:hypothetical protein
VLDGVKLGMGDVSAYSGGSGLEEESGLGEPCLGFVEIWHCELML